MVKPIKKTIIVLGCVLFALLQVTSVQAKNHDDEIAELQESVKKLKKKIRKLKSKVETNSNDIVILADAIAAQDYNHVNVDCTTDPTALQQAIDAAPAIGVAIGVSGECAPTFLIGKSNIVIDGLGSGSVAGDTTQAGFVALYVEASQHIVIQNITVNANAFSQGVAIWDSTAFIYNSTFNGGNGSALEVNRGAYAALGNLNLNAPGNTVMRVANNAIAIADETININNTIDDRSILVEHNAALTQASGHITANGTVSLEFGASAFFTNADLTAGTAIIASRNSNVTLQSDQGITVNGAVQAFSASNITVRPSGPISMTGDSILIQRNSSMMINGSPAVDLDYPSISARQNAVLDFLSVNFVQVPTLELILGSGMRLLGDPQTANCDGTEWTAFSISCAP